MIVMKEFVSLTMIALETGQSHVFCYHNMLGREMHHQKHDTHTYYHRKTELTRKALGKKKCTLRKKGTKS